MGNLGACSVQNWRRSSITLVFFLTLNSSKPK